MALKIPAKQAAYRLVTFAESLKGLRIESRYTVRPLEAAKVPFLTLEIDLKPDQETYCISVDKHGLVALDDVEQLREIVHKIVENKRGER